MAFLKIENFKKLFVLLTILCLCSGERIIPDSNFPVMIKYASTNSYGTSIQFRFKLPTRVNSSTSISTGGLSYGQYFGIKFSDDSTISFTTATSTCTLTDSLGTTSYSVSNVAGVTSSISSTTADGTITYCRFLDTTNTFLAADTTYVLTLTLANLFPTTVIQNLGLFTSTSNTPDRIIIDSIPNIGSVGLYKDFTQQNLNKIATIEAGFSSSLFEITSPTSPPNTSTLYPGYTINIALKWSFKSNWIVNPADYLFYVKYDTTSFSLPTSISSSQVSAITGETAATGTLSPTNMTDGVIITGFQKGDIYPNRTFKINLVGVTTYDANLAQSSSISLEIFYKDTFSIVSYSSLSMSTISVITLNNTTVKHPELFPIYDGMGWPFQFEFSSPVLISKGGYAVIRQRNYDATKSSVVLVASTCDFSLNSGVDNGLGSRWNCYPLRNNFSYDTTTGTTLVEGQGIFFKISTLSAGTVFYLRVWGFVNVCLGTDSSMNYVASLNFTIRIFKNASVNDSINNETRFFGSTTNYVIASATNVEMTNNCYNLQTKTEIDALGTDFSKIPQVRTDQFQVIGIEVNNINLTVPPTDLSKLNTLTTSPYYTYSDTPTSVYDTTNFPTKYIMDSDSGLPTSNLLFFANIRAAPAAATFKLADYIPSECRTKTDGEYLNSITESRIQWLFSRNFLVAGTSLTSGCQLSWKFFDGNNTAEDDASAQEFDALSSLYFGEGAFNGTVNSSGLTDTHKTTLTSQNLSITNNAQTETRSKNIDTTSSQISSTSTGSFKIISNSFDLSSALANVSALSVSLIGGDCSHNVNTSITGSNTSVVTFGLYSDCLAWDSYPTNITWMYTYFEIQGMLTNGTRPLRVIRFIKLFPEVGVFNSPVAMESTSTTAATYTDDNQTWVVGHYKATYASAAPFAVCLIEIDSKLANAFKDTDTNNLVVWLFATTLLETDVNSESSEYPTPPLSSVTSYGLNSGQTMSINFRRLGDNQSATKSFPVLSTANSIGELEKYFMKTVVFQRYADVAGVADSENNEFGFNSSRTLYHFYLGSTIIVPASSSLTETDNLFIPILCPQYSNQLTATAYDNGIYWVTPIISAAWVNMSAYNSITAIGQYIQPKAKTTDAYTIENFKYDSGTTATIQKSFGMFTASAQAAIKSPIQFPLYNQRTYGEQSILAANPRTNNSLTTRLTNLGFLNVKYYSYADTTTTNADIMWNITSGLASTIRADSITIALSSTIAELSSTISSSLPITVSNNDTNFNVDTTSESFYIMGHPFNRLLTYSYSPYANNLLRSNIASSNTNASATETFNNTFEITTSTTMTISGIPRLTISDLNTSSSYIHLVDYFAIFSTKAIFENTAANNYILTNFKYDSTATFSDFLILHPTISYSSWTATLAVDVSDNAVTTDYAGNINISGSLPAGAPIGSKLNFTVETGVLISTSLCSLVENTIPTTCSFSSNIITCPVTVQATAFNVCCYNIYNDNTVMTVSQGTVTLPYNTSYISANVATTYSNTWYQYPQLATSSLAFLDFSSRATTDLTSSTSSFYPTLDTLSYSLTSTEGGFSVMTAKITLPRNAIRGMTINIVANFSSNKITNITPRVYPTFGSSQLYNYSPDQGDIFVKDAYSAMDSNGISITLKNMIYKCKLSLSNTLYVRVWPVLAITYSPLSVSISMKDSQSNDLSLSTTHTVTTSTTLSYAPIDGGVNSDICSISNIDPSIPGEYATYTFTLAFSTYSTALQSNTANEVIIYFPNLYYGDSQNVLCYNGTTLLQCEFIYKNLLAIRFTANVVASPDTGFTFKVVGIKNPYLAANNNEYFGCSINSTTYNTSVRKNLLRGYFKFTTGIYQALNAVTFGNIVFKNELCYQTFTTSSTASTSTSGSSVSNQQKLNPRENPSLIAASRTTVHNFGFTLDIANDYINNWNNGFTFGNSPVLYITFPEEYKFHWYSFTPTATIKTFTLNIEDNKTVEAFNLLDINTVTVVGNQLRITFLNTGVNTTFTSFTLNEYYQYFEITLNNIPTPVEDTTVATGRLTTGKFNFLFFNGTTAGSTIFKSFSNLNTMATESIATADIFNNLLTYHKGFKYEFDETKWVVDVISGSSNTDILTYNSIEVNAGRYTEFYFKRRAMSTYLEPGVINITITNTSVNLLADSYDFATSYNSLISFYMGAPCVSNPGYLILTPSFTGKTYSNSGSIYNLFLPMSPIFTRLSVKTKGVINFSMDNTVRINGSTFVDFTVTEPPYENIEIDFTESTESKIDSAIITAATTSVRTVMRIILKDTTALQSYTMGTPSNTCFQYQNSKIRFKIDGVVAIIPNNALTSDNFVYYSSEDDSTLLTNQLKFVFSSAYTQIYLYSVLTCINEDFPTTANMISQNVTSSSKLQYFSDILNVDGQTSFSFSNLIRGVNYKLKVVITSTQGDSSLRTSSTIEMVKANLTNGTSVDIVAPKSVSTLCASYRFVTRPGIQVTNPLLWYWQDKFNTNGFYQGGCIVPVDQYGTDIPGLPSIKDEENCGKNNCRFVEYQNYTVNETSLGVSETYTICAYPLSSCQYDSATYQTTFDTILSTLSTNTTFLDVLNIQVTPEFTITTITDTTVPNAPTINSITSSGLFISVNATSTSNVLCYVNATVANTGLTVSDFDNCEKCTVINISTKAEKYSLSKSSLTEYGDYTIYAVCFNDNVCSSTNTGVITFGTVTLTDPSSTDTSTSTDNTTDTGTTNIFINTNILLLLIFIAFDLIN